MADSLERIIATDPVVTIEQIDADGAPWFDYYLTPADGRGEHHFLAITEDDSWEPFPG